MKKLLIYGGTFDPPHLAHTQLAKKAMDYLGCEKVLFTITATSPFKKSDEQSSATDRLAMLKLAIQHSPWAEICTVELDRGETSYTIDTLETLRTIFGENTSFSLLIGEDQAEEFDKWHRADDIEEIANIAVLAREGSTSDRFTICPMKKMPLSSTQIRLQVKEGIAISNSVCPEVSAYITRHGLYK